MSTLWSLFNFRMKKGILFFFVILTLTLSGCWTNSQQPTTASVIEVTSTPEPTQSATATQAATTSQEASIENGAVAVDGDFPEDLAAQLDAFIQSQVLREGGNPEGATPGLVLLVDSPEGRYLKAAGESIIEAGTPMQVDDHLEIGSNTKSMTIVLLMQLVEEDQLSLDDLLKKWLPDQAAILPNGAQITLRQMAQHTAGLWDYGDDIIGSGVADPAKLETAYTPAELVQYAADNGTPYFSPGEEGQWYYSNTGYILLGMIIEKVTGKSLVDLYQERIFDPLGLESAVFIEGVPETGEITTHGYWWMPDGERVDTTNWNASQGWAAGAAAMTASDLAKYAKGLAAGEFFENPDTLAEMLTFNPDATYFVGGPYGLGLIDFAGDGTVWGHAGQTLGFQSLWFIKPETGLVVVGLTNSANYSANAFVNVLNIMEGDGALPLQPQTLLPAGDLLSTTWDLTQFVNPAESTDTVGSAGLRMIFNKDMQVIIPSKDCGPAVGVYTVDGTGQISFEIDPSTFTCEADSPAPQFVQYLNDAVRWKFANGGLIIELPVDGGSLVFTASKT